MATLTFDTLDAMERLRSAGMPDAQAKAFVESLRAVELGDVASKGDLREVRDELKLEIANVKTDMVKWLLPVLLAQAGLIVTLVKLL